MLRASVVAVVLAIGVSAAVASGSKPAGDLDPWFGNQGRVLFRPSQDSGASDLTVQPDGKVVIAGSISERRPPPNPGISDFLVLRLNHAGALDSSFGRRGSTRTAIVFGATRAAFAYAVAVGPDGRIVVAGKAYRNAQGEAELAVARYMPSGAPDTSFAGDGVLTMDTVVDEIVDLAVQPDGKVVMVGAGGPGFVVMRLSSDGTLDESFGFGGIVLTNIGDPAYRDSAGAVAVLGDGRIVVAGTAEFDFPPWAPNIAPPDFALVRYLSNGRRDATFGEDGIVVTHGPQVEWPTSLVATPDGKIVVAGSQIYPSQGPRFPGASSFHLARYLSSGALDPTFGVDGTVTTRFTSGQAHNSSAASVAVEGDGKVIAGGTHYGDWLFVSKPKIALARYSDDGALDGSFGVGGKRTFELLPGSGAGASAIGIQPHAARSGADRLVAAGRNTYAFEDTEVAAIGVDLGPPPPRPPTRCRVPRVIGLRLGRARTRIRKAHCRVGRLRRARSTRPRGRVISQRPRAGRYLPRGGRVSLVVSRGR